jgi:hypothetical protein
LGEAGRGSIMDGTKKYFDIVRKFRISSVDLSYVRKKKLGLLSDLQEQQPPLLKERAGGEVVFHILPNNFHNKNQRQVCYSQIDSTPSRSWDRTPHG